MANDLEIIIRGCPRLGLELRERCCPTIQKLSYTVAAQHSLVYLRFNAVEAACI
jgi:hypothetical protein